MRLNTDLALSLAKIAGNHVFIETGTYQGDSARWAVSHFKTVYTIERSEELYREFSGPLTRLGVRALLGDSRRVLPGLLQEIGDEGVVVWLDGHWSGGQTAGRGDECPLLGELSHFASRKNDIILIDDARLFLCPPPPPHDAAQWPTMTEIMAQFSTPFVQVVGDIIVAVPDIPPLRDWFSR